MQNRIPRRQFLKSTALASAGVAIAETFWDSSQKPFKLLVAAWSVNPLIFGDTRKDG